MFYAFLDKGQLDLLDILHHSMADLPFHQAIQMFQGAMETMSDFLSSVDTYDSLHQAQYAIDNEFLFCGSQTDLGRSKNIGVLQRSTRPFCSYRHLAFWVENSHCKSSNKIPSSELSGIGSWLNST